MCFQKKDNFQMDIFNCEIYFQKRFWEKYISEEYLFQFFSEKNIDTNICLAYDEKAHAAELLYKENSYPSFSYQFNSFELSL